MQCDCTFCTFIWDTSQINRLKHSHVDQFCFLFCCCCCAFCVVLLLYIETCTQNTNTEHNNYHVYYKFSCGLRPTIFYSFAISNKSFYKHFAKMDIDVIQMITIIYIAKTHGTFHVRAFVFSKKYVHLMCVVQSAHCTYCYCQYGSALA